MDEIIELLESTANMMRGMTMDPRIPAGVKECMADRIIKLENAANSLIEPRCPECDCEVYKPGRCLPCSME